ncbi:MAG: glycosyltransferase [Firmicutes bacterium]|nr:glycosyltransferase [Bacillota bacterium]
MKKAIFVLGMHRSGTSVLTAGINALGAKVINNTPKTEENPKGYYEHGEVQALNDEILKEFNTFWGNPYYKSEIEEVFVDEKKFSRYYDRAKKIINVYKNDDVFVIKDPRMSILYPFWEKVVREVFSAEVFKVVILRNPMEVIKSLLKRNESNPFLSLGHNKIHYLKLWTLYNFWIIKNIDTNNYFITFDEFVNHPRDTLVNIAKTVSVNIDDIRNIDEFINNFLERGLKHYNEDIDIQMFKTINNDLTWIYNFYTDLNKIANKTLNKKEVLTIVKKYDDIFEDLFKDLNGVSGLLSHYYYLLQDIKTKFDAGHGESQMNSDNINIEQLYIDFGEGYSEENSIVNKLNVNQSKFTNSCEFTINHKVSDITGIRYDPLDEKCILKLKNIKILTNKEAYSVGVDSTNANYNYSNVYLFLGDNPSIILNLDGILEDEVIDKVIINVEFLDTDELISDIESSIAIIIYEIKSINNKFSGLNEIKPMIEKFQIDNLVNDKNLESKIDKLSDATDNIALAIESGSSQNTELSERIRLINNYVEEIRNNIETSNKKIVSKVDMLQAANYGMYDNFNELSNLYDETVSYLENKKTQDRELINEFKSLNSIVNEIKLNITTGNEKLNKKIDILEFKSNSFYEKINELNNTINNIAASNVWKLFKPKLLMKSIVLYKKIYRTIKKANVFDEEYYLKNNEDISKTNIDPLEHYIKHGAKELRNPSTDFDTSYYIKNNPDVKESGINPLFHYIVFGYKEGRLPSKEANRYDEWIKLHRRPKWYNLYRQIENAKIAYHIFKSKQFDNAWYFNKHPDLNDKILKSVFWKYRNSKIKLLRLFGKALTSPILHYVWQGVYLGYEPSPTFNTDVYLNEHASKNFDIVNPFYDYILSQHNKTEEILETNTNKEISKNLDSISDTKLIEILRESPEFDAKWYLNENKDVANAGIDPVEHFYYNGWKEGRNPNKDFNLNEYRKQVPEFTDENLNPFMHYLLVWKKQYGQFISKNDIWKKIIFNKNSDIKVNDRIDIIVVVSDSQKNVVKLIDDIDSYSDVPYRLIIVDDCIKDIEVKQQIEVYCATQENTVYLRNDIKIGKENSINKAIQLFGLENHKVIIHSNIELYENFLSGILKQIIKEPNKVSSVRPMSNTIQEVLSTKYCDNISKRNEKKQNMYRILEANNINLGSFSEGLIAINKSILQKNGLPGFISITNKENSWFTKASNMGYENRLATDVFIKLKDKANNDLLFLDKRANIDFDTQNSLASQTIYTNYCKIMDNLSDEDLYSERFLIINSVQGGGSKAYIKRKIQSLNKSKKQILLWDPNTFKAEFVDAQGEPLAGFTVSLDLFNDLVQTYKPTEVIISSIVFCYNFQRTVSTIIEAFNEYKTELTYLVHDYYCVCPSFNLLDYKNSFCGLKNLDKCKKCLKSNTNKAIEYNDIDSWRLTWENLLDKCDNIQVFSNSSRDLMEIVYPKVSNKIQIRPHDVSYCKNLRVPNISDPQSNLHIGFVGDITISKGLEKINEFSKLDTEVSLTVIGRVAQPVISKVNITGRYSLNDLPAIIEDSQANVFFISSIWPETFCYVADELMQMKLPIVCYNLGAQADKIRKYKFGYVLDIDMPFNEQISSINEWRKNKLQDVWKERTK